MHTTPALTSHSDETILSEVKKLRRIESRVIADLVLHLAEIDQRQLYRDAGYSSLFAYCTQALEYSEGSAQRRITAARCLHENPEIYELLRSGKLSLCALSQVAKVITPENKTEVFSLTQGRSKENAQRVAARYLAPVAPKRESVRAKRVIVPSSRNGDLFEQAPTEAVEERFMLNLEVDGEFMGLLEEAKKYGGAILIQDVLKKTLLEYVKPRRVKERPVQQRKRTASAEGKVLKPSRYISVSVRDEVRKRDGEQCTYISGDGKRCCETHRLQFDHQVPFARGGERSSENLRLLCPAHNQLHAEKCFGREFMKEQRVYRHRGGSSGN